MLGMACDKNTPMELQPGLSITPGQLTTLTHSIECLAPGPPKPKPVLLSEIDETRPDVLHVWKAGRPS